MSLQKSASLWLWKNSPVTVEYSPDETDTGNAISIGPPLQKDAPCMEDKSCVEIFSTLHSAESVASLMTFTSEPRGRNIVAVKGSGRDKRPFPLLCVYLTTKTPSIRDKTTAVKAIIPDLTLIKVIIVFLICNAKSAKPDQYINTIKLDRCGPSIPRRQNTCMTV